MPDKYTVRPDLMHVVAFKELGLWVVADTMTEAIGQGQTITTAVRGMLQVEQHEAEMLNHPERYGLKVGDKVGGRTVGGDGSRPPTKMYWKIRQIYESAVPCTPGVYGLGSLRIAEYGCPMYVMLGGGRYWKVPQEEAGESPAPVPEWLELRRRKEYLRYGTEEHKEWSRQWERRHLPKERTDGTPEETITETPSP